MKNFNQKSQNIAENHVKSSKIGLQPWFQAVSQNEVVRPSEWISGFLDFWKENFLKNNKVFIKARLASRKHPD